MLLTLTYVLTHQTEAVYTYICMSTHVAIIYVYRYICIDIGCLHNVRMYISDFVHTYIHTMYVHICVEIFIYIYVYM